MLRQLQFYTITYPLFFVDINNYDLNMSFEDLKKKYSNDCVAVIAVHFGGHPCEMDKIVPWAKKKKFNSN